MDAKIEPTASVTHHHPKNVFRNNAGSGCSATGHEYAVSSYLAFWLVPAWIIRPKQLTP